MATVGAIRWDGWYASTGSATSTARALSQPQYIYRAPVWAARDTTGAVAYSPTTATMTAEISAAVTAKLAYWAFFLYSSSSTQTNGYNLFQANPNKASINWCQIRTPDLWGTTGNYATQVADATAMCLQSNYQKILTNRPLVYVAGTQSDIDAAFGNSANFKTALDAFRTSCTNAGLGNPYMVVLAGSAALGASRATALGADAISGYNAPIPATIPGTYADLTASAAQFWTDCVATGKKTIPIAQTGWDRRPRIEYPADFEISIQRPYFGMSGYFTEGTPAAIAAHVKAASDFVAANPSNCDGPVLIYAWNEFDEGGWLCPTLGDPSGSRCAALGAVL